MAFHKNPFIPFALALLIGPLSAHAATLSFSAGQGYAVGQAFSVVVLVSTAGGESINAVSANVSYDPSRLQLVSIAKTPGIISMWASDPTFSNQSGTADLEGIILNPGFAGQGGTVATLNFKALAAGAANIAFSQASVLANDGAGTNVLTAAPSKSISIGTAAPSSASTGETVVAGTPAAPAVISATNPDPAKWYTNASPSFAWGLPADVTAVRLEYDDVPIATPSTLYKPAISSKTLSNVADGTHYLHVQFKNAAGWGAVAHFKFQVDTTPPVAFKITEAHPDNVDDPRPILYFNTTDAGSGIDHYDVKFGDDQFLTVSADSVASNPYTPPPQSPGTKTVIVNAYDKAGNVSTAMAEVRIAAINAPVIDSYPSEIQQGDLFKIQGRSYPDSAITVSVKDQQGIETTDTTRTLPDGHFILVLSKALDVGAYTFTAMVTDAKGAESFPTAPYSFSVQLKALYRIGSFVIDWLSVVMLVLAAAAIAVGGVMYAVHRLTLLRRKMRRALTDAEKTIHERFADLQDEMIRHISILEAAKSKRQLTKEEKAILESFKKSVASAEREVVAKLDKAKKEAE